jgi:hypothetical protein
MFIIERKLNYLKLIYTFIIFTINTSSNILEKYIMEAET